MKIRKSLYTYILMVFTGIFLFLFFVLTIYFKYARKYLITIFANQNIITENKNILVAGLFSGISETLIVSVIFGLILITAVAIYIIKPLNKIINATKQVAKGDFSVKLEMNRKDEIGELAHNFNKMVKELNNNEYLSKEFMSNVSHEFKTPIASIQGFAKLLQDKNITEEEKQEYISIIIEETERLANLSNNIQKISRLENKDIVQLKDEIMLDEQIRRCIVILNQKLEEKNINISMNEKSIKVIANEEMLQQVWINLINNAIKYTKENGQIEIVLDENDEFVIIEIKDNGIGISEDKQDKIFEKFYQVDSSHASEGNGLGLAIVKKIIDLHNGTISLDSKIGEGSTFKIKLPKDKSKKDL